METHVKVLAVLHIVFGTLGVFAALVIFLIFGGTAGIVGTVAHDEPGARIAVPIIGLVGSAIFMLILIVSVPGIIAGYGLLQFAEWARILAIVLCILQLLNIPFGTALGIYGLWVLFNQRTILLFQRAQPPR